MLNIALVVGFNSDLEAQSIRASLEYFGARVVTYWIGRPKDFVEVLSGKNLFNDINYAWRIPWKEEPGGLRSVGSQSQTRLK